MLVWFDLETTGLDPTSGNILEIGAIVTTPDLEIVNGASFVIENDLERCRSRMCDYVKKMHEESGLLSDLEAGEGLKSLPEALRELTKLIRKAGAFSVDADTGRANAPPLCGYSVHFDRKWLDAFGSSFLRNFSHRNIDVSTVRRLASDWYGYEPPETKPKHRALADCLAAIEELSALRGLVFK